MNGYIQPFEEATVLIKKRETRGRAIDPVVPNTSIPHLLCHKHSHLNIENDQESQDSRQIDEARDL